MKIYAIHLKSGAPLLGWVHAGPKYVASHWEGCQTNSVNVWSLAKGGGESANVVNFFSLFFQKLFKTSLGPPNYVYTQFGVSLGTSAAIETALKVARGVRIL